MEGRGWGEGERKKGGGGGERGRKEGEVEGEVEGRGEGEGEEEGGEGRMREGSHRNTDVHKYTSEIELSPY